MKEEKPLRQFAFPAPLGGDRPGDPEIIFINPESKEGEELKKLALKRFVSG